MNDIDKTLVNVSDSFDVDLVLYRLKSNEDLLQMDLDNNLTKQCEVESKMKGLSKAMLLLSEVSRYSAKLDIQIAQTAELSESVSAKVRRFDLARSRVSDCQQRVHDLIDLQLCSQGVMNAIVEEDFEAGAGHIDRFLAMDLQLLKKTADDVQGSVTSVSEAIKKLEKAAGEIGDLVVRKFDEAVKKDDLASIERFFKIFPLLGRHQEGVKMFSNYICNKLGMKAQKELRNTLVIAKAEKRLQLAYADTLTCLLENFARVIEVNQPIVEACYGYGHMLQMLKILQCQCDIDVKALLMEFIKSRQIGIRTQLVNEGLSRNLTGCVSNSVGSIELSPKDIDVIVAEIAIMHSRAELYYRFMKRRIAADIEKSPLDKKSRQENLDKLNEILIQSDLSRQMQELLGTYLLFERYFMEESVIKAISLDTFEIGQLCSSMVDDVFFIIRKSIRRSVSCQSVNGTCAVINNAATCLDNEFINALRMPLKLGYSSGYIDLAQAYNVLHNSLQQGRVQASDCEKSRAHFLVQLNNADISTEYIETLLQTMEKEIKGAFPAITKVENQLIESCLAELKTVRDSLKACVEFGMQQLRSSTINPRIHPWVDQFLNHKHLFTEEELASYEAGETFMQSLIVQIDGLLNTFKQNLTPRNVDALISIVAAELTHHLEGAIKKCAFNRLGGLVLDQEVRALGAYLTSVTSWSIRDKMARLTQIATILNLETLSEINDYWNLENGSELSSWRITCNEFHKILALRTDFRLEDIRRIKFLYG